MNVNDIQEEQINIRRELQVLASDKFDVHAETQWRIDFLANYLLRAKCKSLVLGISGGVDSAVAGMLAQRAVEQLRFRGYEAQFIAVRLPYGVQRDEAEAMLVIDSIKPDVVVEMDIKPATQGIMEQMFLQQMFLPGGTPAQIDFVAGNVKARQRMIAQYAIAGANQGLVIGTDHGAEAVMGFFTKFGDGAADVTPLSGLNKRQVRAIGRVIGVPTLIVDKVPTADLEDLDPGKPDEAAYGVTYDQIDDFLEGKDIDPAAAERIITQHRGTKHKRALPVGPA